MNEKRNLMIITAPCWRCEKEMLIALIGGDNGNLDSGPEGFSDSDKKLAEQHGVLLKTVESKTAEKSYLANVCRECGAFVGQWFYFTRYYTPALCGYLKYRRVSTV